MKANWLDKTVSFISPTAGAKRMRARLIESQISNIARKYDGASVGRRTEGWKATNASPEMEIAAALPRLRARSRDLVRNEPYAKRALAAVKNNVIGPGIMAKAVSPKSGREKNFNMLWREWCESVECDFDGRMNFYGLQSLMMSEIYEAGEVIVRRIRPPSSSGLTVPLQIQVLEPDHLDTSKDMDKTDSGGFIIQGVEYSAAGRRVAYWLYRDHPGGGRKFGMRSLESDRIPAEDVIHLFQMERAGQVRGVPGFAPILVKMRDFSDFSDATLLRQKLAACFVAFVTNTEGELMSGDKESAKPLGEKLEPGIIEVLKPGLGVEFANPPAATSFGEFSREQLRAIAAGLGVTYEILTGDYSQVNFSSGRMGWIEFGRNIDTIRWQMFIPHACRGVWKWFTEAAGLAGYGYEKVGSIWTPPRREMIDPAKEITATKMAVRSGLMSQSEAIRENGYEPDEVFAEIAADNEKIDSLGIVLDTDPRKIAAYGYTQPPGLNQEDTANVEQK